MNNFKADETLLHKKFDNYTDKLKKYIQFLWEDKFVDSVMNSYDSLTMRPYNAIKSLHYGEFTPEIIEISTKTYQSYILQIDSSISIDKTINRSGTVVRADTTKILDTKYFREGPDGYVTFGALTKETSKNAASRE